MNEKGPDRVAQRVPSIHEENRLGPVSPRMFFSQIEERFLAPVISLIFVVYFLGSGCLFHP